MGTAKGEPRAKDWLASEVKSLCEEWAAGVPTAELAAKYERSERAIEVMARDSKARRPKGFNRPTAWQRIEKSFETAEMQTVDHMILTTGMWKSTILKAIGKNRHLLHVGKWVESDRTDNMGKLKAVWVLGAGRDAPKTKERAAMRKNVNPFAVAAGQIVAPVGQVGRRYVQDMTGESLEDRRRAA